MTAIRTFMRRTVWRIALLVPVLSGPAIAVGGVAGTQPADMIILNARAYTLDREKPWAEAVAFAGGRITYVGETKGARALAGEHTVVMDMAGKTVMPGFISAHDHLVSANWLLDGVHLFDVSSVADAVSRVKDYARSHPDEKVLRGIGWMKGNFERYPTAAELDEAVPDRPAFLIDYTGHDAWLNTAAMRVGGIDRTTPDRQPGTAFWVRDAQGNPTGVGVEGEWMRPFVAAGAWDPQRMLRESTEVLFSVAASHGTTTLQDTGLFTPNIVETSGMKEDFRIAARMLADMDARGDMPLRVQIMPILKAPETDPKDIAAFAAEMKRQYDSDTLRVRSLKIHPAANMESYGSPLIEPYADKPTHGHFGVSPELIRKAVLEANAVGVDVVIHVWGDAEVRAGVNAIEAARGAGYSNARNSLHHVGMVHPEDFPRIVDMDIPLNVTPMFSSDWSGQDKVYVRLLGKERAYREMVTYPDLVRAGVSISISADTPASGPYETQAPLYNVEAAMTLRSPMDGANSRPFPPGKKGLTLEQALRAVTMDAAWQLRMEDRIGSLEVGKYADLVVLEKSPFDVAPEEIHRIKILATIKDGKFTHRDGI